MKILIVSYYFSPENKIASVRPTKIAKFLKKYIPDSNITVISRQLDKSENSLVSKDLSYCDRILRFEDKTLMSEFLLIFINFFLRLYKWMKKISHKKPSPWSQSIYDGSKGNDISLSRNKPSNLFNFYYTLIDLLKSKGFTNQVVKYLRKDSDQYDIVISSFGPYANHWIANNVKSFNPEVFWLADFRDPVKSERNFVFPFKKTITNYTKHSCGLADVFLGVSRECLTDIKRNFPKAKRFVVPNGYDKDEISSITSNTLKKFTITYVGSLYSGKSDLMPLLKCIKELNEEQLIDYKDICLVYAGRSKDVFLNQVSVFSLEHLVIASDTVPKSVSLQMQKNTHFLLLSTWNNKGEEGIITGKLLEYMMMNRPIVALVSGNLENSTVKKMIEEGNLGVCYEEANRLRDEGKLKQYIHNQYNLYKAGNPLLFEPESAFIQKYDYGYLTGKIIDIIRQNSNLLGREGEI